MRILFLLLSGLLFSEASASDQSSCNAYSGWETLIELSSSHIIMFGEVHGTNETAEAVSGIVCELASRNIPIRFGVEASHDQSKALNAAFTWPLDRGVVLKAAPNMWSVHDGRGSQAVYDLLSSLGKLRSEGHDISIFAFDYTKREAEIEHQDRYDVMAREVDNATRGFSGAVLLFAGDFHTVLNPPGSDKKGGSLATQVTTRPAIALRMRHLGGEIFAKISFGGKAAISQQVQWPARMPVEAPSKSFDLTPSPTQSGYYYVGQLTPSPPAFPELAPED